MNYDLLVVSGEKINVVSDLDHYRALSFGRVCKQRDGQFRYVINEEVINNLPEAAVREGLIRRQRTIRVSVALHNCRPYQKKEDNDSELLAVVGKNKFNVECEAGIAVTCAAASADVEQDEKDKGEVTVKIENSVFHDYSVKERSPRIVDESAGYFLTTGVDKLFDSIENGDYEDVVSLYARCRDKCTAYCRDGNCLHVAARRGDVNILRFILDQNVFDINSPNRNLQTPIFLALRHKNIDLILLLYARGARLDYVGGHGETLLHLAAEEANAEIIRFLLAKNIEPNQVDDTGNTPLHYAIHGRHVEIIQCMINYDRTDLSITNNDGEHCLHLAVRYRIKEIIRMLIYYAPYLFKKANSNHELPIDLAISEAMEDVVEILKNPVMSLLELSACVIFRHYSLSYIKQQQLPPTLLPYIQCRENYN